MTMQSDLRACLLSVVTGGVWFAVLPQDAAPTTGVPYAEGAWQAQYAGGINRADWSAIVIAADIVTPDNAICGAVDLEDHRVQIDLYTAQLSQSLTLRPLVFAAVEGKFPHAVRLSDMADYDADLKLHRRIIEFSIPSE